MLQLTLITLKKSFFLSLIPFRSAENLRLFQTVMNLRLFQTVIVIHFLIDQSKLMTESLKTILSYILPITLCHQYHDQKKSVLKVRAIQTGEYISL